MSDVEFLEELLDLNHVRPTSGQKEALAMDFVIDKVDFNSALKQILQGRKETSGDVVDLTANYLTLALVVTGRSVDVSVEAKSTGSASVPIGVMFALKRASKSYEDEHFRIRISEGKVRFQGMSISNPSIIMKKVARRIIDIPEDARAIDVLSLRHIFSVDEIEDCGLHGKVLQAQTELANALDSASCSLHDYGIERTELAALTDARIKAHSAGLRKVLFTSE